MFQRWRSLSCILLGLVLSPITSAASAFQNTAIIRTVVLRGSAVHVTTAYTAQALESGVEVYTIALGSNEKQVTSWLQVTLAGAQGGSRGPLAVQELGFDASSQSYLYDVKLPKLLKQDASVNLLLETVQTRATYPLPQRASQGGNQTLQYDSDLFILSPYSTVTQKIKIRCPTPRIISYTEPDNYGEFFAVGDVSVTKSGSTITYGPFKNIPPSTAEFVHEYQQVYSVHHEVDFPVLEVTQLNRNAEISHWGANLNIQDEIHLRNAGPELSGHFSRIDHQTQAFMHRPAPHVMTSLSLQLPAGIRNTYYYDLIGNVSTSRLRVAPSVPRNARTKGYSVLELKPRYPLMGGWNYTFTLGWDSPLQDSARWDADHARYIVGIPVMTVIPGAVINQAEIKIILPEGATDAEVFPPFSPLSINMSTHTTYLDTTGRPAITLQYEQLTEKHNSVIYVTYRVPLSAHFKKPVAVGLAFLAMFVIAIGVRRVDFRIHKD